MWSCRINPTRTTPVVPITIPSPCKDLRADAQGRSASPTKMPRPANPGVPFDIARLRPFQMVAVAQRLQRKGVRVEEFPQTVPNLTACTSNLYDLISSRAIVLYPDAPMRLAINRAILHESSRGWRLDKLKQAHKIDLVVALSMAAFAAVRGQGESSYETPFGPLTGENVDDAAAAAAAEQFQHARFNRHVLQYSGYFNGPRRW